MVRKATIYHSVRLGAWKRRRTMSFHVLPDSAVLSGNSAERYGSTCFPCLSRKRAGQSHRGISRRTGLLHRRMDHQLCEEAKGRPSSASAEGVIMADNK